MLLVGVHDIRGTPYNVCISKECTIGDLKKMIEDEYSVHAMQTQLMLHGVELNNQDIISSTPLCQHPNLIMYSDETSPFPCVFKTVEKEIHSADTIKPRPKAKFHIKSEDIKAFGKIRDLSDSQKINLRGKLVQMLDEDISALFDYVESQAFDSAEVLEFNDALYEPFEEDDEDEEYKRYGKDIHYETIIRQTQNGGWGK